MLCAALSHLPLLWGACRTRPPAGTPQGLARAHSHLPLLSAVSILFFEMNLSSALFTGLVAGVAYSFMVRLMYRQHYAAMQRMAEQQQAATARAEAQQRAAAPAAAATPAPPAAAPQGVQVVVIAAQ